MARRLVEKNWASRNLYLEKGDLLLLLEDPTKPLVTARTRHGRNIRVPLSILSKESVEFHCQLCGHPSFPDYAHYTAHLIEEHFRDQLMAGLDNTGSRGGMPGCPFPVCSGTLWGSLEALLMHYASHHHVLEKLMMYESERQCVKYRSTIQESDEKVLELKDKIAVLEQNLNEKDQIITARLMQNADAEIADLEDITKKELEEVDVKFEDVKSMIKKENVAVTNIENQTLKMEFLQIKMQKEKLAKLVETKTKELELMKAAMKTTTEEMSKDQKNTVDMCKQWKEVCLAEEAKHVKEVESLKADINTQKKEIYYLKNIIEIGKATVEHAKQISTDLAEDNKQRELREAEYQMQSEKYKEELSKISQELDQLTELVRFQNGKIEEKNKENSQLCENFKDLSSKYSSLLEVIKQKDLEIDSLIRASSLKENREKEAEEENMKKINLDRQELTKLRKQLDGHKNLKMLYDNLQKKYSEEREARETDTIDFRNSRIQYEEQNNILLRDLDASRDELNELKEEGERTKRKIDELESDLSSKDMHLSLVLDDLKSNKSKVDRFDDISAMLANKTKIEEELKKKVEKMSAELKVQGWEIENYKNKLISFQMTLADMEGIEENKAQSSQTLDQAELRTSIASVHLINRANNNAQKEVYENEYCENPPCQDGTIEPANVKIEIPDEVEEKVFATNQSGKRDSSSLSETPDPKRMRQ